jgi:hypothetical protein
MKSSSSLEQSWSLGNDEHTKENLFTDPYALIFAIRRGSGLAVLSSFPQALRCVPPS